MGAQVCCQTTAAPQGEGLGWVPQQNLRQMCKLSLSDDPGAVTYQSLEVWAADHLLHPILPLIVFKRHEYLQVDNILMEYSPGVAERQQDWSMFAASPANLIRCDKWHLRGLLPPLLSFCVRSTRRAQTAVGEGLGR